jgi:hypothetical protein
MSLRVIWFAIFWLPDTFGGLSRVWLDWWSRSSRLRHSVLRKLSQRTTDIIARLSRLLLSTLALDSLRKFVSSLRFGSFLLSALLLETLLFQTLLLTPLSICSLLLCLSLSR